MLIVSPPVASEIAECLSEAVIDGPIETDSLALITEFASSSPTLRWLCELVGNILEEQGFVQIRGLGYSVADQCFPLIGSLIGRIYVDPSIGNAIIPAHVGPSERLMGNQLRALPLHTDYSMLDDPPRFTLSLCVEPDPTPDFGRILVSDIESLTYGLEGHPDVQPFFSVPLPFAAQSTGRDIALVEKPVIERKNEFGELLVRYHRSRIAQGFKHLSKSPSSEQSEVMESFERMAASNSHEISPQMGDITIIDNHRTVHGRTRCSISLNSDRTTSGRKMKFLFVQQADHNL